MARALRLTLALLVAALGVMLTGCSGMRVIDAQVRAASLGEAASLQGAHYRFERTPLTQGKDADVLEAQTEQALSQWGLVRDETAATVTVAVNLRVTPFLMDNGTRGYGAPYAYGTPYVWGSGYRLGLGWGMGARFPPSTYYHYELNLLMREVSSAQAVYETQAVHEGPWRDTGPVLDALLQAALRGFPNPEPGVRRVDVTLPR